MDGGAIRRWAALGAAALSLSGAFALAAPGTADAATRGRCAGREVRTLPFRTGTVHLYRSNGYVCAITVAKKSGSGVLLVSVQARGNRPVTDQGRYKHHAGPVTVHAGHRCVKVRGAAGRGTVASGWILC
ncbi:hypothetical protein E5082_26410 [Streptomyces griseoluteus]|uniref:Secreted protein n=1 Tax=Streptomyces griseoluteus TaxID=29306 RepID=A0A4Z1D596_STRGP|nr:hypothetical protein [Streptomyces griseoluteus]TGN77520.1 hypothetical protein E5082_26410 [Streptomyces griseoluteus]GHF24798.1 hypothetical protein GCM10017776_48950 [Streptomyces griseoluteus]